jgi:hypothetical protein
VASAFQNRYIFRTMSERFPHGVTLKKKEGTLITVESQSFRFTSLISERFIDGLEQRVAVFEGRRVLNEEAVILKLRLQCVPLFRSSYLMSFTNVIFTGRIHPRFTPPIDRRS